MSKSGHIRENASGEKFVGKGKRRQKVVVESLPTKFLGTTQADSGVIVMRDVQEEKSRRPSATTLTFGETVEGDDKPATLLSAQDIEIEVKGKDVVPEQADVNASIEALRAEATGTTTVVDKKTFKVLARKLTDGYTAGQLSSYLVRFLRSSKSIGERERSSNVKGKLQELAASKWRPGTTPISQRASGAPKKPLSNKTQYADQILRLCWWMTIESEEQVIGEIEVRLKSWQASFLFDLERDNGRPYVEEMIDSQTLLDVSTITPYRPASIMRITARRKDAEEIVRRINLALLLVHRLDWDVKALLPPPTKAVSSYFRKEDVLYISRLTKTAIFIGNDGIVTIHGTGMRDDLYTTRRLLLSLLPSNMKATNMTSSEVEKAVVLHSHVKREHAIMDLPVGPAEIGLHRRYTSKELVRRVRPCRSVTLFGESVEDVSEGLAKKLEEASLSLARDLDRMPHTVPEYEVSPESYWRPSSEIARPQWKVDFCRLLQEHRSALELNTAGETAETNTSPEPTQAQPIVQSIVPGTEAALSYFTPAVRHTPRIDPSLTERRFDSLPFINAHFVPANPRPSADAPPLPTLTLRFNFKPPSRSSSGRDKDLVLTAMVAELSSQTLNVPLPLFATDMQCSRTTPLKAFIRPAMQDKAIAHFVHRVQKSARAGVGALTAPSELTVRLPRWVVEGKTPSKEDGSQKNGKIQPGVGEQAKDTGDVPVTYLFTRFEQVQSLRFHASPPVEKGKHDDNDISIKTLMGFLRRGGMAVEYREIEGGAIHGNGTLLAIRSPRSKSQGEVARVNADMGSLRRPSAELAADIEELGAGNDAGHDEVVEALITGIGPRTVEAGDEVIEEFSPALPLVQAALNMARVLTKGCAGSLKPMGVPKNEEAAATVKGQ
jgi:hypothetical protein